MSGLIATHQLTVKRRRKAEVSMRKMTVANRLQQITKQIGDAQRAKSAREQLFNSTLRQSANALQTMLGMQMQYKSYMQGMQMRDAQQGINKKNYETVQIIRGIGEDKILKDFDNLPTEVKALFGIQENETSIQDKEGKDIAPIEKVDGQWKIKEKYDKEALSRFVYLMLQQDVEKNNADMMKNHMENQNAYFDMQNITNQQNYLTNIFNLQSEFIDSSELETLNSLETQLKAEQDQLNQEDNMLAAEIQALEKMQEEAARKEAPKYIA